MSKQAANARAARAAFEQQKLLGYWGPELAVGSRVRRGCRGCGAGSAGCDRWSSWWSSLRDRLLVLSSLLVFPCVLLPSLLVLAGGCWFRGRWVSLWSSCAFRRLWLVAFVVVFAARLSSRGSSSLAVFPQCYCASLVPVAVVGWWCSVATFRSSSEVHTLCVALGERNVVRISASVVRDRLPWLMMQMVIRGGQTANRFVSSSRGSV